MRNHSGHIAATTMSVRLGQIRCVFQVSMKLEDLHGVHFVAIVELLLRFRSPDFVFVQVHKIHSKRVSGITHGLKIHCVSSYQPNTNISGIPKGMLTLIVSVKGA